MWNVASADASFTTQRGVLGLFEMGQRQVVHDAQRSDTVLLHNLKLVGD